MNCERARDLFSMYLEGELDREVAMVVGAHIDQCASCSNELENFKKTFHVIGMLPEVEPPTNFRHDIVMRAARMQHEKAHHSNSGSFWHSMMRKLAPARTIAIACAGAALAILLLRIPPATYEHVAGMFDARPKETISATRNSYAIEASPLIMEKEMKQRWQERKLGRNTVWVNINRRENGTGATIYRVMLSINQDALLPHEFTQRIGAQVYLLPSNNFNLSEVIAAGPEWDGNILEDSPVVVPVMPIVYDRSQGGGTVNLLVTWKFRHREFAQVIFIPTQTGHSRDVFDINVGGRPFLNSNAKNLFGFLQNVSQEYGVPVIVSSSLQNNISVVNFGGESLERELMKTLRPAGLDWLIADDALYVDKKYDVEAF